MEPVEQHFHVGDRVLYTPTGRHGRIVSIDAPLILITFDGAGPAWKRREALRLLPEHSIPGPKPRVDPRVLVVGDSVIHVATGLTGRVVRQFADWMATVQFTGLPGFATVLQRDLRCITEA